jgi:D-glycero-alpha-D-manno-heptose-7-phosphate kinase
MILTKTPLRISLLGGGTDLPSYSNVFGGAVLSLTIDQYVYVAVNEKFEAGYRIAYSKTENTKTISQIEHPIVREVLQYFDIQDHLEIASLADIPSNGSGLGSSSAFTVGLINGIMALQGVMLTKEKLAATACEIEIERMQDPIGKQDQYATSFGGINQFNFVEDGSVKHRQVVLSPDTKTNLEESMLLFYTGVSRSAAPILHEQSHRSVNDSITVDSLHGIKNNVETGRGMLERGEIPELGALLGESWHLKKNLNSLVTNDEIDAKYRLALSLGAWGGKILGAGGGGFFLLLADPSRHDIIADSLGGWKRVVVKLDNEGTTVRKI